MDPYTAQMLIYRAEMYILMKYPYLIDLNKKNSEIPKKLNEKSQFYIIKSYSDHIAVHPLACRRAHSSTLVDHFD